jgi:hypothetical protein
MSPITKTAGLFCTIVALAVFSIESLAADAAKEMAALQAVDQNWTKAYNPAMPMPWRVSTTNRRCSSRRMRRG